MSLVYYIYFFFLDLIFWINYVDFSLFCTIFILVRNLCLIILVILDQWLFFFLFFSPFFFFLWFQMELFFHWLTLRSQFDFGNPLFWTNCCCLYGKRFKNMTWLLSRSLVCLIATRVRVQRPNCNRSESSLISNVINLVTWMDTLEFR